jgi:hypothetical protein
VSVTAFSVQVPSAHEKEQAAFGLRAVIRVRGGDPVYVARAFPDDTPAGADSAFTLYEDLAGHKPLCSVAGPATGTGSDAGRAVTGPHGEELAVLRPPARRNGWRPRWEMVLADGTRLAGRGGTMAAWALYVVLSPLLLLYNVAGLVGGYGGPDWFLPARTAWRRRGGLGLGRAPLKFYGTTDKYKVRTERLDPRVAYAQAVLHDGLA